MTKGWNRFRFLRTATVVWQLALTGLSYAAAAPESGLSGFRPDALALRATNSSGDLAVFEPGRQQLTVWRGAKLEHGCRVGSSGAAQELAIADGHALFVSAISNGGAHLQVVDVRSCAVTAREEWRGEPPVQVVGRGDGWLLVTGRYRAASKVFLLGPGLNVIEESAPFEPLSKSANPGAARLIVLSTTTNAWLIPRSNFLPFVWKRNPSRWEPMTIPQCLEAEGFELKGEENLKWLRSMLAEADEKSRPSIEALIASARSGKGGGYVSAVSAGASYGETLGLLVRSERGARCTLRLLRSSGSVAEVPLDGSCPPFLALSQGSAWLQSKSGFIELPLPKRFSPLASACEHTDTTRTTGH